jgi:hypothetical protein
MTRCQDVIRLVVWGLENGRWASLVPGWPSLAVVALRDVEFLFDAAGSHVAAMYSQFVLPPGLCMTGEAGAGRIGIMVVAGAPSGSSPGSAADGRIRSA